MKADKCQITIISKGSGCVAQSVERSLPIPEVRGLNSVIGKYLFKLNICLLSTVYWKDKNKEKEARNGPIFFKKNHIKSYTNFAFRKADSQTDAHFASLKDEIFFLYWNFYL